jgi:hypothetical protein
MKRVDLIRHLERHGCEFLREGNNRVDHEPATVPRHREGNDFLARKICTDPSNSEAIDVRNSHDPNGVWRE